MYLQVVIVEPYKNFKEKIRLTKKHNSYGIQDLKGILYIERWNKNEV